MRSRVIAGFAAAVMAVGTAIAQDTQAQLTIKGDGGAGAMVELFKDGAMVPLGTAGPNGILSFDPSLLSGKPRINLRIQQCPAAAARISLFPATANASAEERQCQDGCRCRRKGGAFPWGDDAAFSVGGGFSLNSPVGYGVIGGAAALTGLLATRGDNTAGAGGAGSPGGGTSSFSSITGTYSLTGTVQSRGGCSFNNFTSTFTLGGSETATTGQLIESIVRNMTGRSLLNGGNWSFTLNGSGTVPGAGNYTETFTGQVSGSTLTGTEMLTLPCGTVTIGHSGTKR